MIVGVLLGTVLLTATPTYAQCKVRASANFGFTSAGPDSADVVGRAFWSTSGSGVDAPCSAGAEGTLRIETWINGRASGSSSVCELGSAMTTNGACLKVEASTSAPDSSPLPEAALSYGHTGLMYDQWCGQARGILNANPGTAQEEAWGCAMGATRDEDPVPWGYDSDGNPCPEPQEGIPGPPGCSGSPVLLPLTRSQAFKLTNAANGVNFDLDNDGLAERTAWTAADSRLAFLAIDRNGNGQIDDGSELFGNYTLPGIDNGFAALNRIEPQGTSDLDRGGIGRIDASDPVYARLLLWEDANHNGVSEPHELQPLSNVYSTIGAGYSDHKRRDGHGNEFRFEGWALYRTQPGANLPSSPKDEKERQRAIFDVFFVK